MLVLFYEISPVSRKDSCEKKAWSESCTRILFKLKVTYQAMKRHERKVAGENRKATKYFGAGKQNDAFRCWKKIWVQEQEIEDLGRNSKTILPIEFYFIAILFSDSLICLHKIAIYIQIVELFNLFSFFFFSRSLYHLIVLIQTFLIHACGRINLRRSLVLFRDQK